MPNKAGLLSVYSHESGILHASVTPREGTHHCYHPAKGHRTFINEAVPFSINEIDNLHVEIQDISKIESA